MMGTGQGVDILLINIVTKSTVENVTTTEMVLLKYCGGKNRSKQLQNILLRTKL